MDFLADPACSGTIFAVQDGGKRSDSLAKLSAKTIASSEVSARLSRGIAPEIKVAKGETIGILNAIASWDINHRPRCRKAACHLGLFALNPGPQSWICGTVGALGLPWVEQARPSGTPGLPSYSLSSTKSLTRQAGRPHIQ
jgi:hypothetical protein